MADVFLSYAREDRARAEALANAILSKGWSVWWDHRILVGQRFSREIERELDAAQCVIVLWSANSIDSDWVLSEAAEGMRRGVLVPVLIETSVRIPIEFRRLHTANLAAWPGGVSDFDDCLLAIQALVKPKRPSPKPIVPQPAPAPDPPAEPPAAPSSPPVAVRTDRTLLLVASYLWVLALIPFLVARKDSDRELSWHAMNGLRLFIAELIAWVAFVAIGVFLPRSNATFLLTLIECPIWFAFLTLHVINIGKAVRGQRFIMPIITKR